MFFWGGFVLMVVVVVLEVGCEGCGWEVGRGLGLEGVGGGLR